MAGPGLLTDSPDLERRIVLAESGKMSHDVGVAREP